MAGIVLRSTGSAIVYRYRRDKKYSEVSLPNPIANTILSARLFSKRLHIILDICIIFNVLVIGTHVLVRWRKKQDNSTLKIIIFAYWRLPSNECWKRDSSWKKIILWKNDRDNKTIAVWLVGKFTDLDLLFRNEIHVSFNDLVIFQRNVFQLPSLFQHSFDSKRH